MKTFIQISKVFFLSLLLANCSSDDSEETTETPFIPPAVSTVSAGNITGLDVTLNGNIGFAGSGVANYGFCVGTEANPSIGTNYTIDTSGSHTGSFSQTVSLFAPNTVYHARAYATTTFGFGQQTTYGNDITFTTGYPIEGLPSKNIVSNAAFFRLNVLSIPEGVSRMGMCYGTLQNPTITNGEMMPFEQSLGYQEYTNNYYSDPLTPNTIYYTRAFYELNNGDTYYGPQSSFRSAGYYGPAGGYVAYDKGELTDGWRYLEVDPTSLTYNGGYVQWGCDSTLISNTYPEMGAGWSNTQTIVSGCGAANCAARLCNNFVKNGYSDWFLGSRDEMITIVGSLKGLNVNIQSCWTSTETTAAHAYEISLNGIYVFSDTSEKYSSGYALPVRRY